MFILAFSLSIATIPVQIDPLFYSWVNIHLRLKYLRYSLQRAAIAAAHGPWLNEASALLGDNLTF